MARGSAGTAIDRVYQSLLIDCIGSQPCYVSWSHSIMFQCFWVSYSSSSVFRANLPAREAASLRIVDRPEALGLELCSGLGEVGESLTALELGVLDDT